MKMIVRKKKKKGINLILKLVMIIIIGIFCSFMSIRYFSNNVSSFFITYAEDEITRIITVIVNDSINNEIIEGIDDSKIFEIIRNNDGEIQLISYNAKVVNTLLNEFSLIVQNNLKLLENGEVEYLDLSNNILDNYDINLLESGIICEIPFGSFFNSSLISNIGPRIPVKFSLLGDVSTNIVSNVKEYGINNALLEVSIEISVNARVNLPFISNKITVNNVLPISMKIIQGSIPNFYTGGFQSSFGVINSFSDI